MVRVFDIPEGEELSADFEVYCDTERCGVYCAQVSAMPYNTVWPGHQRPEEQSELASFCVFEMTWDATVKVVCNRDFKEAVVRPLSKKIQLRRDGNTISFLVHEPGGYTVELDGHHHALHIFANPRMDIHHDESTLYFCPGVHEAGIVHLRSNQRVVVDYGAVVYGGFIAYGCENITITGGGIIDGSREIRVDSCLEPIGSIKLHNCRNVSVSGVIMRNSVTWSSTVFQSENIVFDNIKNIGMYKYNTDGIDFVNSSNCTVKNCFLRCFDDVVVIKGLKGWDTLSVANIHVYNCVLWCDWGRALEIGAETCADEYKNITFENCDIIHADCILMDIQNGDRASVHDIVFSDIRCEYSRHQMRPVYQHDMNAPYDGGEGLFVPLLFKAHLYCGLWSEDYLHGENKRILLRDICVYADEGIDMPQIVLQGVDGRHMTTDVTIENLTFNEKKITTLDEANVVCNEFTDNIRIL